MKLPNKIFLYLVFLNLSCNISAGVAKEQVESWHDFPKEKIEFYLGADVSNTDNLNELIKSYHAIPKDQLSDLDQRIAKLQQISKQLQQFKKKMDPSLKSKLDIVQRLSKQAQSKAQYLLSLKKMHGRKDHMFNSLLAYHTNFQNANGFDDKYQPMVLVNRLLYDAKLPTFWGYYWLESFDPCHRQLTDYYLKWQAEKSAEPFFMWLEVQSPPYYTPSIHYFNNDELPQYEIQIQNGLLYDSKEELLNIQEDSKAHLFVITLDKKLYVTLGSDSIRHTSVTHGKPVLASGELKVQDGILKFWNTESGHYQPTIAQAIQTAQLLKELQIKHSEDCSATIYTPDGKKNIECISVEKLAKPEDLNDLVKTTQIDKLENLL